ncbi:hypothetical protein HPB50_009655 [Hyalomma asiaticum]|uniref:Uncharacterized protein n=1 Tax=Hyalomma asiaticum TaxID=266040 RepID=A0ACB7S835_HYAAI|nr:hypothetical protein HPB50_009655 [Hyalomma asiaticum]
MEHLKSKRTSRRAQNARIINKASAVVTNLASYDQLNSMHERLKANSDELRSLNNEIELHSPDDEFQTEYNRLQIMKTTRRLFSLSS